MAYRRFVDLPWGQMHVAGGGADHSPTVVLLHQTPRSWAEYRAVLPLLAARFRVLALDTPGFGDSDPLPGLASIEGWAQAVADALEVLGVSETHVVGHHTGGVVAVELAAAFPDLVGDLVLSSTPYTDAEFRGARAGRPPIDGVTRATDGGHLLQLWSQRQAFYPEGRTDLLEAFVLDALRVIDTVEQGHRAVATYRMEERIASVRSRCLVVRATEDPFASPFAATLCARVRGATLIDVPGGMVPLPDQLPEAFAKVVGDFLEKRP